MEVIPVLDIMNGRAVSGKSGRRWEYTNLKTVYSDSSDPVEIARALPHERLYVADLDGITGDKIDYPLLENLSKVKRLIVDTGVKDYDDYQRIATLNVDVIAATETLQDSEAIENIIEEGCIVSIDMKDGTVLSQAGKFDSPYDAYDHFEMLGADRFIFLDISSVGTLGGNRFSFIEDLDSEDAEIMVGGGIVPEDLAELEKMGVDGVLIGTALHQGLI